MLDKKSRNTDDKENHSQTIKEAEKEVDNKDIANENTEAKTNKNSQPKKKTSSKSDKN